MPFKIQLIKVRCRNKKEKNLNVNFCCLERTKQLAMEIPGLYPRPIFGAGRDLQLWQCSVTNSPREVFPEILEKRLSAVLSPTHPEHGASHRGLLEGSGVCRPGQGYLSLCGCVCCLSQPATSPSGFPHPTSQSPEPGDTHQSTALWLSRGRAPSIHFPGPSP